MKQTYVTDYTTRPVPLGRQGENEVTQIIIPVADVLQEFGDTGSFVLAVKRSGDTLIYPPGRFTWDDENVTWTLTATDTAKSGVGCFGLRYTIGDKVKWSQIWTSYTEPTLDMEQEAQPDVYTSFLEELSERTAELHQDIEGITDEARGYAEAAAASAARITLPLPITSGGTGAATAAGAKENLGIDTTIVKLSGSKTLTSYPLPAGGSETFNIDFQWDYTGRTLLCAPLCSLDGHPNLIASCGVTCEEVTPPKGETYKRVRISATVHNVSGYDVYNNSPILFEAMFVKSSNIITVSGE